MPASEVRVLDPRDPLKPVGRPPQLPPARPGQAGPARAAEPVAEPKPSARPQDQLGLAGKGQATDGLGDVLQRPAAGPAGSEAEALFALLDGPADVSAGDPAAALEQLADAPLPDALTQAAMGTLAGGLAGGPRPLDAAAWARLRLTGPFARAFMAELRGLSPRARAAALGGVPLDVRRALIDALGTDDDDAPASAELLDSLALVDPELAAEVLAWAGPGLARAVAERAADEAAE